MDSSTTVTTGPGARRARATAVMVAMTVAIGTMALAGGGRPAADEGAVRQLAAAQTVAVGVPVAARTPARPDHAIPTRAAPARVSRAAPRASAAPYRFASKRFNHWYAKQYMAFKYRWNATQYRCLSVMWGKESAWRATANNGGSGAHGIPQAMPGSKMSSYGADWRTNPMTQIKWGLNYVKAVYGTPCRAWSFWQNHHWY